MSLEASLHVSKQHVDIIVQTDPLEIKGHTDIEIHATMSHPPKVIFLNARQIIIDHVTIGQKEVNFQYVDSHAALLFQTGPLVRDSSHFSAVSQIVNESPDLIIPYEGNYPVSVHVDFTVKNGSTSIVNKNEIIFTDNRVDGPSGWFPCIDTIAQRSFFSLSVTFSSNLVCIGPGEFSNISLDAQKKTTTMTYKIKYPVSPNAVGFAIAPFASQPLLPPSEQNRYEITLYSVGSVNEAFRNTIEPVPDILRMITDKFNIDEPYYSNLSFATIPFLTESILFPNVVFLPSSLNSPLGNVNIIYNVMTQLIEDLIGLLIYYLFPVGDVRDQWIQHGIISYFAEFFLAKLYSTSYRLDKRWNDLNWLMTEDIFPSIVLYQVDPASGEPFREKYLRTKAKLLINMISSSTANNETQLVLLMSPLMKACESNFEFVTNDFFNNLIHYCPNINFKAFREQWLLSNGFPIFTFNFTTDNRHNNIKIVLAQTPSCKTTVPFFTGNLLIHLKDLEQPYEFQMSVENQIQLQQLSYFAHRRKTKMKKFHYVNGEEIAVPVHHAVMWINLDNKMTWICRVRPRLPQFMILYELKLLHNAFYQHEAISCLEDFKDTVDCRDNLEELLKDSKIFFGVRCHVARALAKYNSELTGNTHMEILLKWYKSEFIDPSTDSVKPHDFHDVSRHFVQLEVIKSLSVIRNSQNYTPETIVKLLIQILKEANNNSNNMYSDDYFNAEVILAFGRLRIESDDFYHKIISLILNKLSLHASIPSYCNIITNAGYAALTAISLKTEVCKPKVKEMRSVLLEDTNYYECRSSVFRDLLFLCLYNKGVTFAELVSDVKILCMQGALEMASMCLREIYRFILNTVHIGDNDHFQTYLLSIPEGMTSDEIKKNLTGGPEALEIAETLWEILTKFAKHHKILRSEALRAYTALYDSGLPAPYAQRMSSSQVPVDLTGERSNGSVVQIDMTRSFQARNAQSKAAATKNNQAQTQVSENKKAYDSTDTSNQISNDLSTHSTQCALSTQSTKITLKKKIE